MSSTFWTSRAAPWSALALALVGVVVVARFVDVSPEVEGEFFFAADDPQMRASAEVRALFPASAQMIVRLSRGEGEGAVDLQVVGELTEALDTVDGVEAVYGVATHDPSSPLFGRVLRTRHEHATNLVLEVDDTPPELLLPRVERAVASRTPGGHRAAISGVPAIVEQIRRSLDRDLRVFSIVAVLVFALVIALVYRDPAIVVGTVSTCFTSVAATLIALEIAGVPIGLLTANLVTIVFVLTLSHIVFLTANWADASSSTTDRDAALRQAVIRTVEPSFWAMSTTLLGFCSLLVATAKPLRELGVAGAVGTVTALLAAFLVYPAFLGRWARTTALGDAGQAVVRAAGGSPEGSVSAQADAPVEWDGSPAGRDPDADAGSRLSPGDSGGSRIALPAVVALVVATLGLGVLRLDTDPPLPSYFAADSEIRAGLDEIDADGGTSTLDVVVRDPDGASLGAPDAFTGLRDLQERLEADSAVGVVLSPVVLVEHARTIPFAGFLPIQTLLELSLSDRLGQVGRGYVTPELAEARFSLRIREGRAEPRAAVLARIDAAVRASGLEPVVVAGLYDLQAQLGRLIASSLALGIGGLLLLFLGIAVTVSRSLGLAAWMWLCLAAIPAVVLGLFGHLGVAVDIITSPSANIALAVGADAMIHLVVRVRSLAAAGVSRPWPTALGTIRSPVLGATAIVCAGFGMFVLSSFPPTRRFGAAVVFGTLAAAFMALVVLPRLADGTPGSASPAPTAS